jgi:hypothetical protein
VNQARLVEASPMRICPAGDDPAGQVSADPGSRRMKRIFASVPALTVILLAMQAEARPSAQMTPAPYAPVAEAPQVHAQRSARYGRLDDHPLLGDRSIVMPEQIKDWIAIDRGYLPTRDDDRLGSGSIFNERGK